MFDWIGVETECRDVRASAHGDELRCLVNRERIRNTATRQVLTRVIIRHPGICVMVPILADGRIMLLRQYRYPLDDELWELPAGTLRGREENGRIIPVETPEACAARELREECGYEAASWEKVAECYVMPGGSDEIMHLYFARGLTRRDPMPDEGEVIREVRAFDPAELEHMIGRGGIRDAKTLVGVFYALGRRAGGVRLA